MNLRVGLAATILVASVKIAHAIDLQPGDLVPMPSGTSLVQFAYGDLERNDLYSNGNKVSNAPKVATQLYQLRFIHYTSLVDIPIVFYVQQPWGNMQSSGLSGGAQNASGYSDTTLLLGTWPYANKETNTYLGMGAYYQAVTGSYNNRKSINLGENRDRAALQVGFQTRFFDRLDWMVAADVTRFGTNEAYGASNMSLTQNRLYTMQTGINYILSPESALGLTLFHTYGGETSLNGVSRHDETRLNRFMVTGTYRLPQYKSVVNLHYGRDLDTLNGTLETKRLIFRITKAF